MTITRATHTRTEANRVVIDVYARISRAYDDTLRSVDAQEAACRSEIARHAEEGWVVGQVFRDHALSAWDPKVHRPEFDDLMARLESGEADGVIVRNLDRFTRKMSEGERLLRVAKRGRLVTALDGRYDLTTARGIKSFREDMVDATYESDRLSERTRRGKRDKAARGKSNASHRGFAMPGLLPNPAGWESGDPRIPVPEDQLDAERDVVREVASMLLAGESWAALVRHLNSTGLLTTYGNDWSVTSMRTMLKRPSLAGIITHEGEEVGTLPGDPVLDRETWDRCQSRMAAQRPGRRPSDRYLLSGLLTCGRCEHLLTGRPRINCNPYPDGSVKREYWCQKQPGRGSGCGRLNIDQRYADAMVRQAVEDVLGDPEHVERLTRRTAQAQEARVAITTEMQTLEADAVAVASKGLGLGLDRVRAYLAPLDARLAELADQLANLDVPEAYTLASADVDREWTDASVDGRRAMVRRAFPNGITIRPATTRGRAALNQERFDWTKGA